MYATEKQNHGSDCSLIVVSLTTENNRIIHIRKAVAFSDFTFLLQTFCNLLYSYLWSTYYIIVSTKTTQQTGSLCFV